MYAENQTIWPQRCVDSEIATGVKLESDTVDRRTKFQYQIVEVFVFLSNLRESNEQLINFKMFLYSYFPSLGDQKGSVVIYYEPKRSCLSEYSLHLFFLQSVWINPDPISKQ